MRITISGAGGGEFRVHNDKREDLVVPASLTGAQAVEKVAEWLAVVPEKAAEPEVAAVVEPAPKRARS
jgi:hypothetical protein